MLEPGEEDDSVLELEGRWCPKLMGGRDARAAWRMIQDPRVAVRVSSSVTTAAGEGANLSQRDVGEPADAVMQCERWERRVDTRLIGLRAV